MVHKLDRSLLKRDIQGLMGISIAINEENEREQLEKLLKSLEAVHRQVIQHINANKDPFESKVSVVLASNAETWPQQK